jgi:hypothetical protein
MVNLEEKELYNDLAGAYTIKSNPYKNFLSVFVVVIVVALILLVVPYVITYFIDVDILLLPFETFDVTLDLDLIKQRYVFGVVGVSLSLIILNLVTLCKKKYMIYNNKIVISSTYFFMFTKIKEIPFVNVFRVDYNKDKISNKILNYGTIILELKNMDKKTFKMEFINNPVKVVNYIQQVVDRNSSVRQSDFDNSQRIKQERVEAGEKINSILDEFGNK